jgi:hypothetical protein
VSRAAGAAALLLATLAGCGGDSAARESRFDPFTEVRDRTARAPEKASARWERVARVSGSEAATERVTIDRDAIQWRARWRCDNGRFELVSGGRRLAAADCPGTGTDTDVRTGAVDLAVDASGPWQVVVDQQVDTPLIEPPLRAMRAAGARVIAAGRFYGLERRGRGKASIHRLPGGRLALRLDGFATSANTDLFVWLSRAPEPESTVDAAKAEHVVLRALKSTIGDQNYLIPAAVDASEIRSIVIWCVPVRIAYTAASLRAR